MEFLEAALRALAGLPHGLDAGPGLAGLVPVLRRALVEMEDDPVLSWEVDEERAVVGGGGVLHG